MSNLKKPAAIISLVVLALLTLVTTAGAICHHFYYSPPAASLACRGCEGAARAVNINDFDLYYRELGSSNLSGAPLVLLHGGPGQSSQTLKHGFDFLADTHRVIFYDQRGSGNSQIRPGASYYTIDQLVEELETLRRDVIRTDSITLIGHSAGGALALRYAMAYPGHIEKIVLVCALPPNGRLPFGGPIMDLMVAAMNVLAGNLPPADPLEADQQFSEVILKANIGRMYNPSRMDLLQDMGYASFAVNRDVTRSTMGGNFDKRLLQLTFPTLIIYGKADNSPFTDSAVARSLHEVLPNSTLAEMSQSGHWPYLEEPEQFQTILERFLTE